MRLRRRRLQRGQSAVARIGHGAECCSKDGLGGRALQLGWDKAPSAAVITVNIEKYLWKLLLGKCTFRKLPFFLHGKVATWEIVIWENVHLRSCRLGNCTFGKLPLGKIPRGSCRSGKGLWEST